VTEYGHLTDEERYCISWYFVLSNFS
jgi:hypothetical protein